MPDEQTSSEDLSFEKALDRLEETVDKLESDNLTMDEALEAYERGTALADRCQEHLEDAEVRIERLSSDE